MQIDAGIDRKDNLAKVSEKVTVPAPVLIICASRQML